MASDFLRYRSQYFEGGRILTGAISAIDIALYDCVGKALGVPVTPAPRHATATTPRNDGGLRAPRNDRMRPGI